MTTPTESRIRLALPLLIYLGAYLLFSYPAVWSITTHVFADDGDGLQNYWNNWWVRHAVANWQNPWRTDFLYAPGDVTLIGATLNPFNGFGTVILCWFVNPITAYNLMVVFAFVAGGYTTFLLARELTGSYWPSVFAGAVFTFSPFHFAHAMGHMQLVSLQWLPFFYWTWIRLLSKPSHGRATLSAFALLLNLLCDYYYTLYAILGGLFLFLMWAARLRRPLFFVEKRVFLPLVTFVLACLVFCGPILGNFIWTNIEDPLYGAHPEPHVNDLLALFIPAHIWRFSEWTEWYWKLHPVAAASSSETGSYLGISVIILAVIGIAKSRKLGALSDALSWMLMGAIFFLLSLGSDLLLLGVIHDVPTLFDAFRVVFPMIELSGNPIRMSVITNLAAAVLCAFGLRYLWTRIRWKRSFVIALLGVFCFEMWPQPQILTRPEFPASVKALRDLPDGIVTGLEIRPDPLLFQTHFQKPMTTGYIARVPHSVEMNRQRQTDLRHRGEFLQLMEEHDATYLMIDLHIDPAPEESELRVLTFDARFPLYVKRDNPNPTQVPALKHWVTRDAPGVGNLELLSLQLARRHFFCVFSEEKGPPQEFDGYSIALKRDRLFGMSLEGGNKMLKNWGQFSFGGEAMVRFDMSMLEREERPKRVWCSLVVIGYNPRTAVEWVSQPFLVEIPQ